MFGLLAEYINNNCFVCEVTVYLIQLNGIIYRMENINKNVISHNIALKPFANLCDFAKDQHIHNTLQMNVMDVQTTIAYSNNKIHDECVKLYNQIKDTSDIPF